MEEWKEYRLGDIITIKGGYPYKGSLIGKGNNYLLSMGCVSFTEQFLDKGARNYEGDCDSRYYVFPGDIVLATRQQSDNLPILGLPAIIPQKYESSKLIVGANLYKVENHNKDFPNSYLYWLLKSPQYIRHIRSCQTGTTVRMITKSNIEDYHFLAPSKSRRNEIARFLWNIENKIELNRKINSNLEEQAKALFKSWFIDFEPFKDGKFVDSELGKIPEGWEVCLLEQLGKFKRGKTIVAKEAKKGDIPVVAGGIDPAYYNNAANTKSPVITVSASGANAGFMRLYYQDVWASDCSFLDNSNENLLWIYCFLNNNRRVLRHAQTGAVQPHVKPADINSILVCIPPHDLISKFQNTVSPLFKSIGLYQKETKRLQETRDTLLPKLMSGEIDVEHSKLLFI